jgi:3-oxoacyl-[acyl-carrier protein] reductase
MPNTYLITGASSDVGCALIERLYREGDVFIAQGSGDLSTLAPLCAKYPGAIHTFDVDLTSEAALELFIRQIGAMGLAPTHFVHLPALRVINTRFRDFDDERFERDLNVQVRSAIALSKAFVPAMAKARFGRVVFMLTSYLIGLPPKNTTAYVMAKSALQGLAKSLAAEYAAFGVTVNSVAPYMMETKFLADTSQLIVQASAEANPMKRNARVEDVAPAIAFLLSDEAGFITGVTLPITGGSAVL